jgi:hypothetical protein
LEETPGRNLTTLIYKADPTANPKVVLRDMVEYGIVKPAGPRHYRPVARVNISNDLMSPQALDYFGRTMTNLASTLAHNYGTPGAPPRLERSVVADGGLPEYALPEFETLLRGKVQKLLVDIDDWLSANRPHWVEPAKMVSTGLTVFHYVAEPYDHTLLSSLDPAEPLPIRLPAWREPALGGKTPQ